MDDAKSLAFVAMMLAVAWAAVDVARSGRRLTRSMRRAYDEQARYWAAAADNEAAKEDEPGDEDDWWKRGEKEPA